MKAFIKNTLFASLIVPFLGLEGCIDDAVVSGQATAEQVSSVASAQKALVDGLVALMVDNDTYGSEGNALDWGYPCQMFIRETFGEDFPISDGTYNYFGYMEDGNSLRAFSSYTYFYYYALIKNANGLIATIDPETVEEESLQYLGMALAYRAMAYMDLARVFEYKETGVASLDAKAQSSGVYGLTVPIVKETTTRDEAKHNPRAPFYTMYRFIMDDLRKAENYLDGYSRESKGYIDQSVAQGLLARMWLEMGTRFAAAPDDLAAQLQHEGDADGYADLDIASANDCFLRASDAAQRAMAGYSPVTQDQWHDTKAGFNTANQAWMWSAVVGTKEQINYYYYYSFLAQIASEPSWGMPQYGKAFRCISASLYDRISDGDWRKSSWVAPEDIVVDGDNAVAVEAKRGKYETLLKTDEWKSLPAYVNLKFRPGSGDVDDYDVGLVCDIPLMRVEEMYFIGMEAQARLSGYGAGKVALEGFMNDYRCEDGARYACSASDLDSFLDEMMVQKRVEFWGEGILFFDYKRMNKAVKRSDSNYLAIYRLNSYDGYVAPWMNYYIPENEQNSNDAIVLNPDPSQAIAAKK